LVFAGLKSLPLDGQAEFIESGKLGTNLLAIAICNFLLAGRATHEGKGNF